MCRRRSTLCTLLAIAALAGAALPVAAAGRTPRAPDRHHSVSTPRHVATVTEGVAQPGLYRVSVTVLAHRDVHGPLALRIGRLSRRVAARGRQTSLAVRLGLNGPTITISAAAGRFTPRLEVRLARIGELARSAPATAATATATPAPTASPSLAPAPAPPPAAPPAAPVSASPLTFPGSPVATSPSAGPVGDPGSWSLAFDDEFNGSGLDASKWSTGWFGAGITGPVNAEELECYDPAQAVEGGGELDLELIAQPESCDGETRPYASGIVTTDGKFSFTYGFIEARVWLPGTGETADWPAVWADGTGTWPQTGELDVLEGLGGQACWHFHGPSGVAGGCESPSFTGGWHTFGADWEEPGVVTWYYDGIDVGSVSQGVTSSPMYLVLDLAADHTYGGPLEPATMRIDYLRVWQHQ